MRREEKKATDEKDLDETIKEEDEMLDWEIAIINDMARMIVEGRAKRMSEDEMKERMTKMYTTKKRLFTDT